jgi:hypothetical protein
MSSSHYEKWFFKLPIGFLLVSGGIFFMYYSLTLPQAAENWIFFGLVSAIPVGIGAILLSSAAVNKMKSDLMKKQKIKQQSGS